MARLVIGTSKAATTAGLVKEPEHYIAFKVDTNRKLVLDSSVPIMNIAGASDVGNWQLSYAYYNKTGISGVADFSSITSLTGEYCCASTFFGCTGITGADLSNLTTVSGLYACAGMFKGCAGMTSVDLSNLTTISGNYGCSQMFSDCVGLRGNIDLSSLTTVSGTSGCQNMFYNIGGVSVDLSSLTTVSGVSGCQQMFKSSSVTSVDLSSLTTLSGPSACYEMFMNTRVVSAQLPSLKDVAVTTGCASMFDGCSYLTTIDLSALETVNATGNTGSGCRYMFRNCTSLAGRIDLHSLITISGGNGCSGMFLGCTRITSIDLSSLTNVISGTGVGSMFSGCTGLNTPVVLHSLTNLNNGTLSYMFVYCSNLPSVSFPSITNDSFGSAVGQFANFINSVPNCTLHFPSNVQAKIETLTGYPNFGGTDTVILYDLPATNTLTGADTNTYSRNPKYDTVTALAWKVGAYGTTNFTPAYYTSGTTDPTVGTTIYSDAACTTSVTTVTAIA